MTLSTWEPGCSVYVYVNDAGDLVCASCSILHGTFTGTAPEMVQHLAAHVRTGDLIPRRLFFDVLTPEHPADAPVSGAELPALMEAVREHAHTHDVPFDA